jgi:3-hydroxyisobutyrate dehydrogenase-like beta-hydroxyacid dehydrogenase
MARNLLADELEVVGFDVSADASQRLRDAGGRAATSVAEVIESVSLVITSVATTSAFREVMESIATYAREALTVVDASTMSLFDKNWAHDLLSQQGVALVDCPISGTGAQAETRDLVFLASGDPAAIAAVRSVLERLGRVVYDLGPFGSGSKMKYVANLLVAIHNVATAEAMVLAEKAGIEPALVLEVLGDSAATSRIFQLRFPLMIENHYSPPTAKISMFVKDLDIIASYAAGLNSPTPLLDAVRPLYESAMESGMGDLDAAAICSILEQWAGIAR